MQGQKHMGHYLGIEQARIEQDDKGRVLVVDDITAEAREFSRHEVK